jgi:hypothetical protein
LINHCLVMLDRKRVGRKPRPSAAVIDSQGVSMPDGPPNDLMAL